MSKRNTPIKVIIRENESNDDLIKRFKRVTNKSGVIKEARKHEEFLNKSLRRKIKDEEAQRRNK